jgi:hypothetical protein
MRKPKGHPSPLAREIRASGAAMRIVYEHKRLGRGIDLAALAEQPRAARR